MPYLFINQDKYISMLLWHVPLNTAPLNSNAIPGISVPIVGSGGALGGGTGVVYVIYNPPTSGGAVGGGTAVFISSTVLVGSGGVVGGGTAVVNVSSLNRYKFTVASVKACQFVPKEKITITPTPDPVPGMASFKIKRRRCN